MSINLDLPRRQIDVKFTALEDGLLITGGGSSPECGPDACQQLVYAEGLCDVIVGSGIEGFNFRPLFAANRKHDNRQRAGDLPYLTAELDAVHFRHLKIGDYQIRMPVVKRVQ